MKFITIEPAETRVRLAEAPTIESLYESLGLGDNIDHGLLVPAGVLPSGVGLSIVVDGFSLFVPRAEQRYFAIGQALFGGNAVVYGHGQAGETVDVQEAPVVIFLTSAGVERAIESGQIARPTVSVNGVPMWKWPEPPPIEGQR